MVDKLMESFMKYKIIRRLLHPKETITVLCCLNCDKPMFKISKGKKIGKQLRDDGWYCHKCDFFYFKRNKVLYYCLVSYDRINDTFIRCSDKFFAIFLKEKKQ
jgi:hypothetical protein